MTPQLRIRLEYRTEKHSEPYHSSLRHGDTCKLASRVLKVNIESPLTVVLTLWLNVK